MKRSKLTYVILINFWVSNMGLNDKANQFARSILFFFFLYFLDFYVPTILF